MGLYEARGSLAKALKELSMRWGQTRMDWDDVVSEKFEQRWLDPLDRDLKQATSAMDHISTVVSAAKKACS